MPLRVSHAFFHNAQRPQGSTPHPKCEAVVKALATGRQVIPANESFCFASAVHIRSFSGLLKGSPSVDDDRRQAWSVPEEARLKLPMDGSIHETDSGFVQDLPRHGDGTDRLLEAPAKATACAVLESSVTIAAT